MGRLPQGRELAEPDLVEDAPGLLVGEGIDRGPLERGEGAQRTLGQVRREHGRLVGRDQGVPAEDRHEPGHPRGRQGDLPSPYPQRQSKGGQVRDGAPICVGERAGGPLQSRERGRPGVGVGGLVRSAQDRHCRASIAVGAVLARPDQDPDRPPSARREREIEQGVRSFEHRPLAERQEGGGLVPVPSILEPKERPSFVRSNLDGPRLRDSINQWDYVLKR